MRADHQTLEGEGKGRAAFNRVGDLARNKAQPHKLGRLVRSFVLRPDLQRGIKQRLEICRRNRDRELRLKPVHIQRLRVHRSHVFKAKDVYRVVTVLGRKRAIRRLPHKARLIRNRRDINQIAVDMFFDQRSKRSMLSVGQHHGRINRAELHAISVRRRLHNHGCRTIETRDHDLKTSGGVGHQRDSAGFLKQFASHKTVSGLCRLSAFLHDLTQSQRACYEVRCRMRRQQRSIADLKQRSVDLCFR